MFFSKQLSLLCNHSDGELIGRTILSGGDRNQIGHTGSELQRVFGDMRSIADNGIIDHDTLSGSASLLGASLVNVQSILEVLDGQSAVVSNSNLDSIANPSVFVRPNDKGTNAADKSTMDSLLYLTWADDSVSWYSYNTGGAYAQLNTYGTTYLYIILGYDKATEDAE